MKSFIIAACLVLITFAASAGFVMAAAPDGAGPWADQVTSSSQGTMKNGGAVPAIRSDANSALGVAENSITDGTFFSLGFGGQITLHFDNGVRDGVISVEATNDGYPLETARIEVSADGSSWTTAGNISQDGQVSIPENMACVNYVRVTDTSDMANFVDDTADGYDVDGVQAVNAEACDPQVTPTPSTEVTPTPSVEVTPAPTSTPSSSNNNNGGGGNSGGGSNQCNDAKPPTPTLLSVNRNSATTAVLTWSTVSPANDYAISYGTAPGNYVYGVPHTGNTNTFTIGGLAAGTNYYFVVRAINGCTPGDPSGNGTAGGSVLGASTGGQVLGASTEVLAATGDFAQILNLSLAAVAASLTFVGGWALLKNAKLN